jgi:endonuclease VIII
MPEGDTIARTAGTLRRWLAGRTITGASTAVPGFPAERLVGCSLDSVESRGKHLLIWCSGGLVVHTHMRMTGSWHVYPTGERWRLPAWRGRLVLTAGSRLAVCFDAPVIELLRDREVAVHPALRHLGPDLLGAEPPDGAVAVSRMRVRAEEWPSIGDLLLDQRVVAGIGNIYRCEALFGAGIHPATAVADLPDDILEELVRLAAELLRAGAAGRRSAPAVYGRAGRPCRRCGTLIRGEPAGRQGRRVYWCPRCQAR